MEIQVNVNGLRGGEKIIDLCDNEEQLKITVPQFKKIITKELATVTRPQRLPNGLYNQGATCYLNSVLQVLFMTTEIHDRLDPESQITDQELRNIFEKLEERTCGTENITQSLEIKNVYQQHDAAECLEMILHKVSQQASEVFQAQLTYTTKCSKGHSINEETNPFWTLPLSLTDTRDTAFSVERGFEMIFQTKSFSGDNMVYCNECQKKTEATSGCEMVKSPQILTLLLKRFDFDYNTMSHVKSNCCVDVPCALQRKNKTYKLYGMLNHMGSLRGGHYTATILSNEDKTWYEFDDTHVKKVEEQPFAKHKTYNSGTVYLLMYRAMESQMPRETNSEGLTDNALQKQDDTSKLDEVECKENVGERDTNDEERQMDEEQMRTKQKKEDFSHQTGGEEGDAESVKNDISDRESSHDINMKIGEDCRTQSELINSGHEEAQENLSINGDSTHSSITQENTNDKFEDLNETKVDDAPLKFGERTTESSQHLDEETKTEKKKQRGAASAAQRTEYTEQSTTECRISIVTNSEDLSDEVEEEQGEDIRMEQLKGAEVRILLKPARERPRSKAQSVVCFRIVFCCLLLVVILLFVIISLMKRNLI